MKRKPLNVETVRRSTRSNAFTLIEMMVVTGMLAILMGVAFSGIGQARGQAKVAKANAEVRELINAWLSYEAAHDDWPTAMDEKEKIADKNSLAALLGDNDEKAVYLNASLPGGVFLDPWENPYRFRLISEKKSGSNLREEYFYGSVTFPNRYRHVK